MIGMNYIYYFLTLQKLNLNLKILVKKITITNIIYKNHFMTI